MGVLIERDNKKIHESDVVQGRFSFGDFSLSGLACYKISCINSSGVSTRSVVFKDVGVADAFALPHAVFFNRGCAGSQKFVSKFGPTSDQEGKEVLSPEKLAWLGKV